MLISPKSSIHSIYKASHALVSPFYTTPDTNLLKLYKTGSRLSLIPAAFQAIPDVPCQNWFAIFEISSLSSSAVTWV